MLGLALNTKAKALKGPNGVLVFDALELWHGLRDLDRSRYLAL
jgi:hypothetical protein